MDSMTKQRREGEANRPTRAKTGQRKPIKPSWTEFVRLADQAVVAIAGADMINRAEARVCGYSRRSRRLDKNGQKRTNGSSCVERSPERFRKGAGGQGWLPAVLGKTPTCAGRGQGTAGRCRTE